MNTRTPETRYDEHGGIVSTERDARRAAAPETGEKARSGYNWLERLLIRRSGKVNYLLDENGRYRCRQERYPSVLRLGITNRCTAQCFYCPRELVHGWGSGYMDFELYRRLIDWCAEHGVGVVGFALWGEPLLHPRFLEMVDYAHRAGLTMRLSTNAIAMNRELAEAILAYPWQAIEMSMDGFTAQEYKAGKHVDGFEPAKSNIEYLLDRARELNSSIVFNVHFVDGGNVSFINKLRFVRYWKRRLQGLKYNTAFYYEPHNWAGARQDLRRKTNFLDRLLSRWELKKPCVYVRGLNVNFDGTVFVCGNNPYQVAELGNINDEPIEDIYNNQIRDRYLTENERGTFETGGCQVCTVNSIFPLLWLKKRLVNRLAALFS